MQINTREYLCSNNFSEELTLQTNKNYLFPLNYLTMLRVSGNNASQFLQGQLTCDMNKVTSTHMQPGALCNIKGRILALLNAILWEDSNYLILPKDLQEKIQKTLAKPGFFSKVEVTPVNNYHIFGFYLQNPNDLIPLNLNIPSEPFTFINNKHYCCYSLTENLYIIVLDSSLQNDLTGNFPKTQIRQELTWHTLMLQASFYEIYPNSSAIFLPHRLNLHKTAYLNFNKGCFIGQEIIARTQYLAKLKHNMYLYTLETSEKLYSGQKIYTTDNAKELGELIDYSPLADSKYLVACSIIFNHPDTVKFAEHTMITNLQTS